MSSSPSEEIQEQPLSGDVEAGISDGLSSIESEVVDEVTEEHSVLSVADSVYDRWRGLVSRERMPKKVGKGSSNDEEAPKLSTSHWPENIDPRHRYGHKLLQYHDVWLASESKEPFFYWLDFGDGKEVNLEQCPRIDLQLQREDRERRKVDLGWIFVIANVVLELPSAVFDQLSSVRKPQFALLSMLMSFAALFICIVELVYKCRKEKVTWKWRGTLPWLYPPRIHKPFGSFKDIIGLVCAICQCVVTTITYIFCLRHADNPIKISVWPIIFAFGLLCSKFLADRERGSTNLPLRRADTI